MPCLLALLSYYVIYHSFLVGDTPPLNLYVFTPARPDYVA